jgi:hypothetical protein
MTDLGEYTPTSGTPWQEALRAASSMDRVMAEALDRLGRVGATDEDKLIATQILAARSTLADAMHGVRQQLGLVADHLYTLNERVALLTSKFPALG